MTPRQLSQDRIETLQSILSRYNGFDHVELLVEGASGGTMRMALPVKVDARNMVLIAEVRDLMGHDGHVQLV